MIVAAKGTFDPDVEEAPVSALRYRMQALRRRMGLERRPRARSDFNFNGPPLANPRALLRHSPGSFDVIGLHTVDGLLDVRTIRRVQEHYRCPILWMLMDQEPVTGGCHYTLGCEGFTRSCGDCPQLDPGGPCDRSRRNWTAKRRCLSGLPIGFACGGEPGAALVRRSSLFGRQPAFVTPLSVDEERFRPIEPAVARTVLGLPLGRPVVMFGSDMLSDPRKGVDLLEAALAIWRARGTGGAGPDGEPVLVSVGHGSDMLAGRLPFEYRAFGYLQDEIALALVFQAADVFVCPSRQDEGPMMVPQAMMCGTPVVAFPAGYTGRLIRNGENGWVCRGPDPDELAEGIMRILRRRNDPAVRAGARAAALLEHARAVFADRYMAACRALAEGNAADGAQRA